MQKVLRFRHANATFICCEAAQLIPMDIRFYFMLHISPFKRLKSRRDVHNINNWTDFNVCAGIQSHILIRTPIWLPPFCIRSAAFSLKSWSSFSIQQKYLLSHCSNAMTSLSTQNSILNALLCLHSLFVCALCKMLVFVNDLFMRCNMCNDDTLLAEREYEIDSIPFFPWWFVGASWLYITT